MSPGDILYISQEAVWVLLKLTLPLVSVALILGLIVSIFQALTQIQEMTLSFIPKVLGIFATLFLLLPFYGQILGTFTATIFGMMIKS